MYCMEVYNIRQITLFGESLFYLFEETELTNAKWQKWVNYIHPYDLNRPLRVVVVVFSAFNTSNVLFNDKMFSWLKGNCSLEFPFYIWKYTNLD